MEITYASINEIGKRPCQEDTVGSCIYGKEALFAVADGLGGHMSGDLASRKMIEQVLAGFHEKCDPEVFFPEVFAEGNRQLCLLQDAHHTPNGMKTTLACAVIKEDTIYGAYAGDSRIYIFEKNKMVFRTLDHSVPQMLVNAGELDEKKIRRHPDRNRLLRVLGDRDRESSPQEIPPYYMRKSAAILLCTDGFWENILEKEMEKTLKTAKDPEEWLSRMKKIVKRRGKMKKQDNYSAVCIWVFLK
ncbi:MAG: protein phosphatase 2C domain-containing protein [Eubacteriales bacterium]|nr:protein phosphatase 2C domain-containing protein [Eubacteriales bacterium]